jgi:hypothetical protein
VATLQITILPDPTHTPEDEFRIIRDHLQELPVENVRAGRITPPHESKTSNAVDVTQLVVTLVPTSGIIAAISAICVARIKAATSKEIHMKLGENEIRLTGVTSETQQRALAEWTNAILESDPNG